jgi:hypothetical protein
MKKLLGIALVVLVLLVTTAIVFSLRNHKPEPKLDQVHVSDHLYVTWDNMEFDKCAAAWLIIRYVDKDANFVFIPQGTDATNGIPFDIPGAAWSHKHRKSTSRCIFESMNNTEPAIEKIVEMADQIELDFWLLDRWPDTQKRFYEVKSITDGAANHQECFERTRPYFDQLYGELKNKPELNTDINKLEIK